MATSFAGSAVMYTSAMIPRRGMPLGTYPAVTNQPGTNTAFFTFLVLAFGAKGALMIRSAPREL